MAAVFGSFASCWSTHSPKSWYFSCPPMTRIVVTEASWSAIASSTGTNSGPTTNTFASASLTMNSTSGGASRQLTSTQTAFRSAAP